MTIGEKILYCRKRAGMSQEALAAELGISRQAVSNWETGEAMPDTGRVVALARLFGVTTDYLLLDELTSPDVPPPSGEGSGSPEEDPPDGSALAVRERRRHFRIGFGIFFLAAGLLGVVCTLLGTGYAAEHLTYWQTELGKFGTALTRTWLWMPLFVSIFAIVLGAVILFYEYRRED